MDRRMQWTKALLDKKQSAGLIRSYVWYDEHGNQKQARRVTKHWKKRSKEKDFIGWNLFAWCSEKCVELYDEFYFDEKRKWRFDYCIRELKIAVEYNGLFSEKSRHTTAKGYTGDMEKINAAQAQGWRVIQLTALNYKTLISELNKYL